MARPCLIRRLLRVRLASVHFQLQLSLACLRWCCPSQDRVHAPPSVPRTLAIDCTGLGGHDLGGPPFDICIRTDKHGQSIYGPSVAPIESQRYENQNCIQVVALGASKAMHEFLVLHYLATDSAQGWENFLSQCIPNQNWMPTTSRRAMLMNMFDKCHIAPSYRRMPHQSWATSMTLLVDLLRGNGKHRYLRTVTANKVPVQVCIRGFSAGSYSGLSMCHLLWRMQHVSVRGTLGGISLPPVLLSRIPGMQGERLLLYHYTNDTLCQWKPGPDTLKALACKYCIVSNDAAELRGHFGSAEHSYGHWLDLDLPEGEHTLWRLLRSHVAIACPRHRDAAPLRLVSWMSCEPPAHIEALLRQLMLLFAEVQPVASEQVVSAARRALDLPEKPQVSWDEIRDAIINGLVVGGNSSPPPEVTGLLRGFLRRLPLPRLVHFLDMILPQVPVKSPCRTSARRFSSGAAGLHCKVCHRHWSRAGVARVFIDWNQQPVLLLATRLLANRDAKSFQYEKGAAYDRQQIQMGLRKGNTVLIHYRGWFRHWNHGFDVVGLGPFY